MPPADQDRRELLIRPDYQDGRHGYKISQVGRSVFVLDEVLRALAFGDEGLADTVAFKTLMEDARRMLDELARTEAWDKEKQQRLKQELLAAFARGCASWYRLGEGSRPPKVKH